MKWLKRLLFLVLLLSCLSFGLSAEVVLTDSEFEELKETLIAADLELAKLQSQNKELKKDSEILEKEITLLEKEPGILNNIVEKQNEELKKLSESLKEQKTDRFLNSIKTFLVGLLAGGLVVDILLKIYGT